MAQAAVPHALQDGELIDVKGAVGFRHLENEVPEHLRPCFADHQSQVSAARELARGEFLTAEGPLAQLAGLLLELRKLLAVLGVGKNLQTIPRRQHFVADRHLLSRCLRDGEGGRKGRGKVARGFLFDVVRDLDAMAGPRANTDVHVDRDHCARRLFNEEVFAVAILLASHVRRGLPTRHEPVEAVVADRFGKDAELEELQRTKHLEGEAPVSEQDGELVPDHVIRACWSLAHASGQVRDAPIVEKADKAQVLTLIRRNP
mmetsp:Transcript_53014/g.113803  ORF Transcript_53014/g.113803 Transcript_53014/m.113803 type:complete len:260 (+) Transcript_53014:552-1331(+)